jgi:hypothetical protein
MVRDKIDEVVSRWEKPIKMMISEMVNKKLKPF